VLAWCALPPTTGAVEGTALVGVCFLATDGAGISGVSRDSAAGPLAFHKVYETPCESSHAPSSVTQRACLIA
jgi:hypothetical protein